VDGAGDEFLARACLAVNQDCRIGRRYGFYLLEDPAQGNTVSYDFDETYRRAGFILLLDELVVELIPRLAIVRVISADAAPDGAQELFCLSWFRQKFSCTCLDRPNRHWDVAMTREEDYRDMNSGSHKLLLHVESAQLGELDI
jgi:hypothetical protein